jgi:hypothetical protein
MSISNCVDLGDRSIKLMIQSSPRINELWLMGCNSFTDCESSIYSAITKVSLLGGGKNYSKHYSADGSINYTIINDLARVCESLPRTADLETSATLRHTSGEKVTDYTYRPLKVERAL